MRQRLFLVSQLRSNHENIITLARSVPAVCRGAARNLVVNIVAVLLIIRLQAKICIVVPLAAVKIPSMKADATRMPTNPALMHSSERKKMRHSAFSFGVHCFMAAERSTIGMHSPKFAPSL